MRGTILKKIVALAVAVCLVLSVVPAGAKAADSDTVLGTYLALGDSISAGDGLAEGEQAFPAIVAGTCNLTLDDQSQSGETSASLLAKLTSGTLAQNVKSADVVTITIGGNDLMDAMYTFLTNKYAEYREQSPFPLPEMSKEQIKAALMSGDMTVLTFASTVIGDFVTSTEAKTALASLSTNFAGIMKALKTFNPNVDVLVATQYNPYAYLGKAYGSLPAVGELATTLSTTFETGVATINFSINSMSTALGYTVVDVYNAFANSAENLCNAGYNVATNKLNLDFHPNAKGHQMIATTVANVINDMVQDSVDTILAAEAAKIAALKDQAVVDQEKVNTVEAAKSWAETILKSILSDGVTADVEIVGFEAAQAGTEDNTAGTAGKFQVVITLAYEGYTYGEDVVIDAVINATEYTVPTEEPDKEDPKPDTNPSEDQDDKKPVNTNKADQDKDAGENTDKAPQTGDTSDVMPYFIFMAAAGAVIITFARRKTKEL